MTAQLSTLHGINAIGEGASTDVDPELLMEMFEARYVQRYPPAPGTTPGLMLMPPQGASDGVCQCR